jgi:NADH dehydrogenase/NADH:ubiquinone oxidoreductase subunit G
MILDKIVFWMFGALTSKPYAFSVRPWELQSVETFDPLDSFGARLTVFFRGNIYMRVLPTLNEILNEEWISDRIRFNYDGFNNQRIISPLLRDNNNDVYSFVDWSNAFLELNSLKNSVPKMHLDMILGDFIDIETATVICDFISQYSFGFINIYGVYGGALVNKNLRSTYLITGFDFNEFEFIYDSLLFFGVNLRLESPVLNYKIRRSVLYNSVIIYCCGYSNFFNYSVINMGNTFKVFFNLLGGKSIYYYMILKYKVVYAFFGPEINFTLNIEFFLKSRLNNIKGMANIQLMTSSINLSEFGIKSLDRRFKLKFCGFNDKRLLFILNSDDIKIDLIYYNFILFQGHHGDQSVKAAHLVFASASYYEKSANYLNFYGKKQMSLLILNPTGNVRNDWKIISVLTEFINYIGFANDYYRISLRSEHCGSFSVKLLLKRANMLISHVLDFIGLVFKYFYKFIYKNIFIKMVNNIISINIYDFYKIDCISRASQILSLVSQRNFRFNYNFIL